MKSVDLIKTGLAVPIHIDAAADPLDDVQIHVGGQNHLIRAAAADQFAPGVVDGGLAGVLGFSSGAAGIGAGYKALVLDGPCLVQRLPMEAAQRGPLGHDKQYVDSLDGNGTD